MRDVDDLDIFGQIPDEIQDNLYEKFLYSSFLLDYRKYFIFEKKFSELPHNYYSWRDNQYRDFMTEILRNLEPRAEPKDSILFYELDDFTEILFFNKGQCDIGFEINRKKHFVLRQRKSIIIADHGCTFNHKSNFIYKTYTTCEGFSIRKEHWLSIMKNYDELTA